MKHGMFALSWTAEDLKGEQLWLPKNYHDTTSTLQPEARIGLQREGSLKEPVSGYTFFWKGKAMDEDRVHGVGLAIKSSLMKQLPILPIGVNERLMKLRLPLVHNRYATIISAYAPTLTSPEKTIEQLYANLSSLLDPVPDNDKLRLLGDLGPSWP